MLVLLQSPSSRFLSLKTGSPSGDCSTSHQYLFYIILYMYCANPKLMFDCETLSLIITIIWMKNNHIYIDESGILNKVFVICFIVFTNKDYIQKTYLKINRFTIIKKLLVGFL